MGLGTFRGFGTERSRIVFEKFTFFDKKSKKSLKKKVVRNFLKNLNFFIFFDFFSENVFKSFLRGKEITRKKYRIVFEKFTFFEKKMKKIAEKKKSCSKFFEKFNFFYFF